MRNAQRAILSLLLEHSRPLSRIYFVKLVFLISKEVPEKQRGPFYEFLPYKYGPFSFALYRDLGELARDGWILGDDALEIPDERKVDAMREIQRMPATLYEGVLGVRQSYGSLSDRELVRLVYKRYPSFTHFSEIKSPPLSSPTAPIAIYTIGYEGASVDRFFNACVQKGIRQLLDVRNNPWSRKWGFTKKKLSEFCQNMKMKYLHIPELGVPREIRNNSADSESNGELLDYYEKFILPDRQHEIRRALEYIRAKPTALVCMEADPAQCHRSRLAKKLAKVSSLPVHNLSTQ
jgi:uncharacterized protein (DUF488 family)